MKPTEYGRARVAEPGLREVFADIAHVQRGNGMPEEEIADSLCYYVSTFLAAYNRKLGFPRDMDFEQFIRENRAEIDPVVAEAMRYLDIE
jgi:hypothetical protein